MRENRTCGSEGGEPGNRASLPLSTDTVLSILAVEDNRSFFLEWGSAAGAGLT